MEISKNNSIANIGDLNYMTAVFNKIKNENHLNIVYLGGSITMGCNASDEENRYVNLSAKWWSRKFPGAIVDFFNAGIGATTSQFGVARAENHVLKKKPDLVFVEFSVNDENTPEFMESYESLIRKLLKCHSVKAVIVINNLYYDTGKNSQGIHNNIAMYYNLPAVSVRDYIYPQIMEGKINLAEYTEDMLHPTDKGHKMVSELIENLLDVEYEYYKKLNLPGKKPELPSPFTKCSLENSYRYKTYNYIPVMNGFSADEHKAGQFSDPFKNGWLGNKKGDSITFRVKASQIFVQYKKTVNHPAPVVSVNIDDNKNICTLDANFEETWGDLCAMEKIYSDENVAEHTVTFTVEQEGINDFMLISLICC